MKIVTKDVKKARRVVSSYDSGAKARAHRAHRRAVKVQLNMALQEEDIPHIDIEVNRKHMLTAWEVS